MTGLLESRLEQVFSTEAEIVAIWASGAGMWEMLAHLEGHEIHLRADRDALGRWRVFYQFSATELP